MISVSWRIRLSNICCHLIVITNTMEASHVDAWTNFSYTTQVQCRSSLNLPLLVCWWTWTAAQMSSYSVISCQTDDRWGSTPGLHFLKLLQFTRAASSESSQHSLSLFLQKRWFGTNTSFLESVNEVGEISSVSNLMSAMSLMTAAVSDFCSVPAVCSLSWSDGPLISVE